MLKSKLAPWTVAALILAAPLSSALANEAGCAVPPGVTFKSGKGAWDRANNPRNLNNKYSLKLSSLPLAGKMSDDKMPWSETYWPSQKGGIAYRWQLDQSLSVYRTPPTREQLKRMSPNQIAQLSAAEKFDIARGRYDYPLVKEVAGMNKETAPDWYGICHGWTPAAYNHREPMPNTVKNPDGIEVAFGSSDVKGLLSYYYATPTAKAPTRTVGRKCRDSKTSLGAFLNNANNGCEDVNAGAFHVILTNQIGLMNESFSVEIDPGHEIWNQPITAYESKVLAQSGPNADAAPGAASRVLMETTMHYADDGDELTTKQLMQRWHPTNGTPDHSTDSHTYRYWLDLDANGNILGGQWVIEGASCAKMPFPDFIWIKPAVAFTGDYELLNQLYMPKH